jgi:hypothetical protein
MLSEEVIVSAVKEVFGDTAMGKAVEGKIV